MQNAELQAKVDKLQAEQARSARACALRASASPATAPRLHGSTAHGSTAPRLQLTPQAVQAALKATVERMRQTFDKDLHEMAEHSLLAEAAAPDEASKMAMRGFHAFAVMHHIRCHALAEYDPVALFGVGGARLRETIERYAFDVVHESAKTIGMSIDFFLFGMEPLGLLLFFGDVEAARRGCAKVLDAHKRMLARVRQGGASTDGYTYEVVCSRIICATLLIANDLDALRELMANSIMGAAVDDKAIFAGLASFFQGPFAWTTDDGFSYFTLDTWPLVFRGLAALVEDDTVASRAKLRKWLPPTTELLRITKYEQGWMTFATGANHPALLCGRLYGERLGEWKATAELAEGVLANESFQPLLRTEALRLLCRAHAALGDRVAACEAVERAAAEAAGAKYVWLEMMSLRELLRLCEGSEAASSVRARIRGVAGRMAASAEELASVLGEGVLS